MRVAMSGFATEEDRWDAVMRRDASADGEFYFAVRTTGVYCRPSCASRRARRENVAFHLTCADAERAGFRPCKRCRPNEAGLAELHAAAVAKACRLIESADEPPELDSLAAAAGMSRFHFHRVFRSVTGVTPKAYADARRSERVREELSRSQTVTDAIYGAGFNSSGRFYEKSTEILGMTPTDFRAGGQHAAIRYATGACSLGTVLVAATEKGVCAILLGDDAAALVQDLEERFPRATLTAGDREFERTVARVVDFVEAPREWDWICRSTCAARRFSSASGRRSGQFRRGASQLPGDRRAHRRAHGGACRGAGVRGEQAGGGDSVPPRGAE